MTKTIPIQTAAASEEARLLKEGWVKQTTIGEPRLSEIVENYKAMGYEVYVKEYQSQGAGCNTCFDAGKEMGDVYGDVYIRKSGKAPPENDELF